MSWAKVDDQWWMHPKVLPLPMAARGLWTTALSYCGQRQSPQVPAAWVDMVAGDEGHNLAASLVSVGLWIELDGGWEIHDWSEYQADAKSEAKQNAGRIGGLTRALQAATERAEAAEAALGADSEDSKQAASTEQAESKQPSKQPPKHGPDPEPVPEPEDQTLAADGGEKARRSSIFEVLCEVSGWALDQLTASARGRTNKAAKELDEIGASVEGIRARAREHKRRWPELDVTPTSLAANYAALGKRSGESGSGGMPDMPDGPLEAEEDYKARMAALTGLDVA